MSIIVPAYQAAGHLPVCVEALQQQTAPDDSFQVLIVDDGSTDGTAETPLPEEFVLLRHEHNRGAAAARNTGARHARGRVLLFVDVDVVVAPGLVEAALDLFCAAGTSELLCLAATGCYDKVPANDGWFPRYKALWTWFCWDRTGQVTSESDHLQGALCAVSRSLFEEVGGFDEGYEGGNVEDYELSTRLRERGTRIVFDARISGRHRFPGFFTVARNYWARTRMWLRLRLGKQVAGTRSRLSSGQANARSGAAALLALSSVTAHGLAIAPMPVAAAEWACWGAFTCDLAYLATVAPFLVLARRHHGTLFALYALAVNFALSVVIGMAALSAPLGAGTRRNSARDEAAI